MCGFPKMQAPKNNWFQYQVMAIHDLDDVGYTYFRKFLGWSRALMAMEVDTLW